MFDYRAASRASYPARSVFVKFKPDGWASLTWNDATGEVAVQSDWLNGTYRWNTGSFGDKATLTDFLADRTSSPYLCDKLFRDHRSELDGKATRIAIKKEIVDARRAWDIDKDQARQMWEDSYDVVHHSSTVESIYLESRDTTLKHLFSESHESLLKYREPGGYTVMKTTVIPALIKAIRVDIGLDVF